MFKTNTCSQEIPDVPWDPSRITGCWHYKELQRSPNPTSPLYKEGSWTDETGDLLRVLQQIHIITEGRTQESWLPVQCTAHYSVFLNACSYFLFPSWATFSLMTHWQAQQVSNFFKGRSGLKKDKIIAITWWKVWEQTAPKRLIL